jgi:hypothetical protein
MMKFEVSSWFDGLTTNGDGLTTNGNELTTNGEVNGQQS